MPTRPFAPIALSLLVCLLAMAAVAAPPTPTPTPTPTPPIPGINPTPKAAPAKPATPDAAAPAKSVTRSESPTRRALLIGVGQAVYKGIKQNPLPQCVIDAKTLAATLGPRGYSCEVVADGEKIEPTAASIRQQVIAAAKAAAEGEHLLIHISTHGDVIGGKSVILATDDAVEIDFIKQQMASSKASVKVLMLDCCRNNKGFEKTATEVRDVHCIMACRPDQLSQVGHSGMSVFTEAIVDALVECRADRVKDGTIELDELMYFLDREVPARSAKLGADKQQNPTRTVVDPKVVTPVFAECSLHDQLTFGPKTYAKTPPPAARLSLELTDLTLLQVQPRMTLEQATAAIGGKWTMAPVLADDTGVGVGVVEEKPSPKDVLVVRFEKKQVVLAHVLYREVSKEAYSPLKIRGALQNVIGDAPLLALQDALKGLSPADIVAKIGSPDSALLPTGQFSGATGELRYPEVPRPGQMLVVRINGGVFDSVDIATTE